MSTNQLTAGTLAERLEAERRQLWHAQAVISLAARRLDAISGDEDVIDVCAITGEISHALDGAHALLDGIAERLEELGKEAQT